MSLNNIQAIIANERGDDVSLLDGMQSGLHNAALSPEEAARAWRTAGLIDRGPSWFSAGPRVLLAHAWPMLLEARDRLIVEARKETEDHEPEDQDAAAEAKDSPEAQPIVKILHVGARAGDLTLHLAQRCRRRGVSAVIDAVDWNRDAVAVLRERVGDYPEIRPIVRDVFEMDGEELVQSYDVVVATNALHRLAPRRATHFVNLLARLARTGVAIQGMVRSPGAWMAVSLLVGAPVGGTLRRDGPAAVRRAFSFEEWAELAEEVNLPGIVLTPHWPCRAALSWTRERPIAPAANDSARSPWISPEPS